MVAFVPPDTRLLIDFGCGAGHFGALVKQTYPACETWGVEPDAVAAASAATRNDKIFNSTLESLDDLPTSHFDVVTMNDVLEHLPYSEPALALVRRILKPDGRLVLSVPNVRYFLNVRDLLFKGDWKYEDFGILDRTHLRFFTSKSIARLVAENGFEVEQLRGINPARLKMHYKVLFGLSPPRFSDMRFPQLAVVCKPNGA